MYLECHVNVYIFHVLLFRFHFTFNDSNLKNSINKINKLSSSYICLTCEVNVSRITGSFYFYFILLTQI